jgi:hypothetical protein
MANKVAKKVVENLQRHRFYKAGAAQRGIFFKNEWALPLKRLDEHQHGAGSGLLTGTARAAYAAF